MSKFKSRCKSCFYNNGEMCGLGITDDIDIMVDCDDYLHPDDVENKYDIHLTEKEEYNRTRGV